MTIREILDYFIETFQEEKFVYDYTHYRIRKVDAAYQITRYQPGTCGTSDYAPQITISFSDDEPRLRSYFQNVHSPVQFLHFDKEGLLAEESAGISVPDIQTELKILLAEIEKSYLIHTHGENLES